MILLLLLHNKQSSSFAGSCSCSNLFGLSSRPGCAVILSYFSVVCVWMCKAFVFNKTYWYGPSWPIFILDIKLRVSVWNVPLGFIPVGLSPLLAARHCRHHKGTPHTHPALCTHPSLLGGAPTHLLPGFLFVHILVFVSHVHLSSSDLSSCELLGWSVICCQGGCIKGASQKRIARRASRLQSWRVLLPTHCNTLQHSATHVPNTYCRRQLRSPSVLHNQNHKQWQKGSQTTGWQRCIGCLKLQVIFRKRATNYRVRLRKMTYKDQASYDSTQPCNH